MVTITSSFSISSTTLNHNKFELPYIAEVGFKPYGSGGYFIIDVNYPEGGRYFSSIPISPLKYRKSHKTKTYYVRVNDNNITIADDYGHPNNIFCSSIQAIDKLVEECIEQEIPEGDFNA